MRGSRDRRSVFGTYQRCCVALVFTIAATACGSSSEGGETTAPTSEEQSDSTSAIADVREVEVLSEIDPGTYFTDPDEDRSTPLRVVFDVVGEGWSSWIGAGKFAGDGHVGVSITTVTNLVRHGCLDHSWADPPIGPSVDDLADALSVLPPFRLTAGPSDVSIYGYHGKYLELTVPDVPVEGEGNDRSFVGCTDGTLKSWVAAIDTEPGDAYYGYTGPGYVEEFWLLDVEGTRLMIAAEQSADSPAQDVEELRTLLESIRIQL